MKDEYIRDFDDFLKEHPEIDPSPANRSFMEPQIQAAEDQLLAFIMCYIFM
jgi:hypothetical protein